jgi:hypothetical protein
MKKICLALLLSTTLALSQSLPPLSINQEKFLSDKSGSLQIKNILNLNVGDIISFHTQDGLEVKGKVFEREEEKGKHIKIYGQLLTSEDAGFGFIFNLEDGFNGAVVLKNPDRHYVIIQNTVDNSFYFVRAIKLPSII